MYDSRAMEAGGYGTNYFAKQLHLCEYITLNQVWRCTALASVLANYMFNVECISTYTCIAFAATILPIAIRQFNAFPIIGCVQHISIVHTWMKHARYLYTQCAFIIVYTCTGMLSCRDFYLKVTYLRVYTNFSDF